MSAIAVSLCITLAVLALAIVISRRLYGYPRFEVRIPDHDAAPEPTTETLAQEEQVPAPTPLPDTAVPTWLTKLEALGFGTFESTDESIAATTSQPGYAICVGMPHPHDTCRTCSARAIRMLGETPLVAEYGLARIAWIGRVCGRCGSVEFTNPHSPRFLCLMLADSRSMLTFVMQAERHAGKTFNEIVTALLTQNEGALQARINLSSTLRAGLPEAKKAKVLLFQKGKRPKRRRDKF